MRFVGVVLGCGVLLQGLMAQAPVERRAPQDKDQVPDVAVGVAAGESAAECGG